MYTCICGKEFENSQPFNGHKSNCSAHLKNKYGDDWKSIYDSNNGRLSIKKASDAWIKKSLDRKANELNIWNAADHFCEKCGKQFYEKIGSGKFCSRSCANSRNQKGIKKPRKSKIKVEDKYCLGCGKQVSNNNKSGYCRSCYHKYVPYSEETKKKQSEKMSGRSRWNIRRNQKSYAEIFFENVLNNNNIKFEREFQVKKADDYHCYYLDFLIDGTIDLEIDGSQHKNRKVADKERDDYLQSIGYTVYRIDWNNINSESGKLIMEEKINSLLKFLNTN